ncbi:hypothetical protein [Derxia gummosa]|uniref:Minor curlin subunit n=1 Tax=Derxia gummosa DSM 723 TaxID=1121388 RepID=A0A8B6XBG6_9BURK|nr:hypothetical protein [Derxia gummosa]
MTTLHVHTGLHSAKRADLAKTASLSIAWISFPPIGSASPRRQFPALRRPVHALWIGLLLFSAQAFSADLVEGREFGAADIPSAAPRIPLSAVIQQSGNRNQAMIDQSGQTLDARLIQSGNDQSVTILQSGIGHSADITQRGGSNSAALAQIGEANRAILIQDGIGNRIDAAQASAAGALRIEQIGNFNQADIRLRSGSSPLSVEQRGQAMTTRVIQF